MDIFQVWWNQRSVDIFLLVNNESEDDDNSDIANNVVKEKNFDTPKQGVNKSHKSETIQDAFRNTMSIEYYTETKQQINQQFKV